MHVRGGQGGTRFDEGCFFRRLVGTALQSRRGLQPSIQSTGRRNRSGMVLIPACFLASGVRSDVTSFCGFAYVGCAVDKYEIYLVIVDIAVLWCRTSDRKFLHPKCISQRDRGNLPSTRHRCSLLRDLNDTETRPRITKRFGSDNYIPCGRLALT